MIQRREIQSISLENYMAFKKYYINLTHYNLFTGPNNSGKSTIIRALQILGYAHRSSRRKNPYYVREIKGYGYNIPESTLPINLANVHNEYLSITSNIKVKFIGSGYAILTFPPDGGCFLHYDDQSGTNIENLETIRNNFEYNIGVVPFLGPVEPEEELLTRDHIIRSINTYLSPRHLRNQWYYINDNPDDDKEDFDILRKFLKQTWPEMDIELPELQNYNELVMFCKENRITREIGWAGCGFQVWIQILSHLIWNRGATTIIIDEPEIYLHPDLQRKFVSISKNLGPQIILASHSVEIINESDIEDIIIIDKKHRSGQRLNDSRTIQKVVDLLGSVQNIHLTRLLRNKRALFVEGKDYQILKKLAQKMNFLELSRSEGVTFVPMGGFTEWPIVKHADSLFKIILEENIDSAILLDRDFRCDSEITKINDKLQDSVKWIHFWERKEIENYIIDIQAIKKIAEIKLRKRNQIALLTKYEKIIDEIYNDSCESYIEDIVSNYQQSIEDHDRSKRSKQEKLKDCSAQIRKKMKIPEERLKLVPGKLVLADMNTSMQNKLGVSFTDNEIIRNMNAADIPLEAQAVLKKINEFRS